MGSCASVHKGTRESAIKLGVSFQSKTDNLVVPESPIKDKLANGVPPIKTLENFGSKDEAFFDSQPWLESDCEDFFSVNGELTPSRGSTPVHHSFSMGTPKLNNTTLENRPPFPGSIPESSPSGKKKRLLELFRESLREEQDADNSDTGNKNIANGKTQVKPTILDVLPKSGPGTPYVSGTSSVCSSERTANGDAWIVRENSIKSKQSCLPNLMSCGSFSDKKKKMSPAVAVNGV